jgi:hypothetical protein
VLTTEDLLIYEMVGQLECVYTKKDFMNVKICERQSSIGGGEVGVVEGSQARRKVGQGEVARHPSFVICPVSVQTGCRNEQAPF